MKKIVRRLTSIMLSVVMVFGIVTPLSASNNRSLEDFEVFDSYVSDCGTYSSSSFMAGGIKFTLRISDKGNGFTALYEYQNDQLIRRGVIYDNKSDRMYITTFEHSNSRTGQISSSVEEVFVFTDHVIVETPVNTSPFEIEIDQFNDGGFMHLGNISFMHRDGTINTLRVSFWEGRPLPAVYTTVPPSNLTLVEWSGIILAKIGIFAAFLNPIALLLAGLGATVTFLGTFQTDRSETFQGVRTRVIFRVTNPNASGLDSRTEEFEAFRYVVGTRILNVSQTFWPLFDRNNAMANPWGHPNFASEIHWRMFNPRLQWTLRSWS